MSDEPKISTGPLPESEHGWVHEHLGAYLAGGLSDAERGRLDAHINGCPACFDDFTEAREADRALLRTLSPLAPGGGAGGHLFEERVVQHLRETSMKSWKRPLVRRAGYAAAAAVALAATGVFANFVIRQNGRFNNPMSQQLASDADARAPELAAMIERMTHAMGRKAASSSHDAMEAGAERASVSVLHEDDPTKIPSSDEVITDVITLKNVDPANAGSLKRLLSADADLSVNQESKSITVTDTAAKVKRLATIISTLDHQNTQAMVLKYKELTNAKASEAARVINSEFEGSSDGGKQASSGRVFADSDDKTNTVVLNGPPDGVAEALRYLDRKDSGTLAAATADAWFISGRQQVAANGGGRGTGGASGAIASSEHSIPSSNLLVQGNNWLDTNRNNVVEQGVGGVLSYNTSGVPAADGRKDKKFSVAAGDSKDSGFKAQFVNGGTVAQNETAAGNRSLNGDVNGRGAGMNGPTGGDGGQGPVASSNNGTLYLNGVNTFNNETKVASGTVAMATPKSFGYDVSGKDKLGVESGNQKVAVDGNVTAGERTALAPAPQNSQSNAQWGALSETNGPAQERRSLNDKGSAVAEQAEKEANKLPVLGDVAYLGDALKKTQNEAQDSLNDTVAAAPVAVKAVSGGTATHALEQGARDVVELQRNPDRPGAPATQPVAETVAPAQAPATAPALANQLKIIRSGTIEFEVRSFDDAYGSVSKIVQDEGGFVSSTSSDKLPNGKVKGTIVVRVPPDKLDRFLLSLRAMGDLKSQQISAADVTKEYTDTDSELRGLRTMETRLLDLIKNGKGEVKDLIAAETKLGETRIQIEKLEGQLKYFDNLVGMATISITAYEKDIQTPTAASEQENIRMNMETEEVEAQYQAARKILSDAKARIIESQLNNSDGEHIAAHILAEVPPDKADFVSNQLKGLGKVISFGRDRKQMTSGGTGGPAPDVHVEEKDTRVTLDLLNLANLNPRETTVLRIAVPDVEATYRKALEALRKASPAGGDRGGDTKDDNDLLEDAASHPTGHVLSSNLSGQKPEQMSADVRAEIRADQADAFLAMLRGSGEVLVSTVQANPDSAGTTSAKRGLQLALVNTASVAPREVVTVNVAVHDVDKAYKDLLGLIKKDVAGGAAASQPAATESALLPPTVGRVTYSNINGQQPEQMTADVQAEVRSDQADAVMQALHGEGELLNNSLTQNQDTSNTTLAKRGLQVRFINQAAIPARETVTLHTVAENVPTAYNKLQAALQEQVAAGNLRVIASVFNQSDARNVNATLAFEVSRTALASVENAFKSADIDFLSRNITRSTDTAGTLDSKVRFQVDELRSAETLPPTRTFTLGMEVDDVERSMSDLRTFAATLAKPAHEADFNVSRESTGRTTGHLVLDFPSDEQLQVLSRLRDLKGFEISNQMAVDTQVPDTRFNKERVDLTLISKAGIVQSDKGLWQSVRAALSSATGALLYSLYLVLTGMLFVLPFVLIVWPIVAVSRRRKAGVKVS